MDDEVRVTATPCGARFAVRVQPRASRNQVEGTYAGAIRVRLAAPPVDGTANRALVDLLARELGVPSRAVRLVSGLTARRKIVDVDGVTPQQVRARLLHER